MRHFLKRTMLLVVPVTLTALVLGIPTAAPDGGLTNVTLTCSDGTNLALSLDAAALTGLTDAVTAIGLYPAGDPPLSCGLTQDVPLLGSGLTSSGGMLASVSPKRQSPLRKSSVRTFRSSWIRTLSASGNPQYDYAVGGGQAPNLGCSNLPTNFALSAHVVAPPALPTTASGTFNVGSPAPNVFCQGHLNSKVDCLVVVGTYAHLTASVTQATGIFSGLLGTEIDVAVLDSDAPDMIDDGNVTTGQPCDPGTDFKDNLPTVPDQPLTHGNINVHDPTP